MLHAEVRHVFVRPAEIEWIDMAGNEARAHLPTSPEPIVAREPLASLEARLDRDTFVRVHRSALVNRNHIRELHPWFEGDYVVIMRRGARVTSGRIYRDAVRRLIGA